MANDNGSGRASRRGRGAVTVSEVAARAGVSPMTVSRVINGGKNVRSATREVVETAITDLGFSPNLAARRLAAGENRRVGLLYSNPSAAYLSEFLVGSLDEARRSDVQLIVEKCDVGSEVAAARHLLESRIDGLILPPPLCNSRELVDLVRKERIPAVAVASGRPIEGISSVNIDDFDAARAMTDYILSLGHRRIGFIEGSPDQAASGRRREGYIAALAGAGIDEDPMLIAPGLFTYRSGLVAAERLLDLAEPPTAIFASNDDMAAATVAAAHRRAIDVPRQLTVCGFDDTALATTIWPELTTIRQPIADMSCAALRMLMADIESRNGGEPLEQREIVDFTLIPRETTAPLQ
ncbi:LacI family transcriptional regulator [Sphingobium sp. OAS761]|uniref:LacI family DNA-binding transcriptional regulator n=1 Tax=Sphingobium sp. OAS761 TaxID=2817901 RepID=UPI00209F83C0|nr:LacI family DNA-binding transcriptional regulator [Sphingobium sp. OAS761]MCP1469260.1 LacI family transcriptional regulator [Sphingobium sp. OAS761]